MAIRMYKKGLVVGIIILFIGVGVQPANADDISEIKETTEENNDSGDWGYGFILCYASIEYVQYRYSIFLSWKVVECIDLETGNVVRQDRTGLFGFCLFKYLPMGRDYKLTISTEEGSDSIIVRDLIYLKRADLRIIVY